MTQRRHHGFTVVEVLFALVLLVVGVLALVGSLGLAGRMVGRGREATAVSQAATARLEWLRQHARSGSPPCTHPWFASDESLSRAYSERWVVPATGTVRQVVLAIEHRIPRGMAHDTLLTAVLCR